jgi:hypothetical protein
MTQGTPIDGSAPSVFISYSHDSPAHMEKILLLARRLRAEGVPCELDQFHESPAEGWPRWMMDQIEESSYVLVCCTENYNLRFRGKAEAGTGKGVKWEGGVITQELYDAEERSTAFIPVILTPEDARHVPLPLRGATHYDLSRIDGFSNLLRRLTGQPRVVAPEVGVRRKPLPDYKAELNVRLLDKEIATDVAYYTAKLGSWPADSFVGEEVIEPLETLLEKVESHPEYREAHRAIWATLYRMVGGAYLLHSKLEMGDKLRAALANLRQSQEVWADQHGLAANIAFLEAFLSNQRGDMREYLTTVLQILRGPADPQISALVDKLTGAAGDSRAQSWLLHEATPLAIWGYLQALQVKIKKERNIDAEIEVASKPLADGWVEVQATIGPNIFLWKVNLDQKAFEPGNELTQSFMGLIAST